jgi:hypothetical protein
MWNESGELSDTNSATSDTYRSLSSYHSTQGELTGTVLGKVRMLCLCFYDPEYKYFGDEFRFKILS